MQVGIRTSSLGQGLPEALETAGRLGFDGLEVVIRDAAQLHAWLVDDGPNGAGALRTLAARTGCVVSSLSLAIYRPLNFGQEDESRRREGVELVCDALRACRNVDGAAVLLPHFDRQRLDVSAAEERRYVDALRACAPVADATGVAIALETSFSVEQLQRIVGAVGSPKVGVYADLANAIIFRQDPAVMLRTLGASVVMLHVKDTANGGQAMLGEGQVDWSACRAALRDIGYAGWCVLETPPGDDPIASARRQLHFTRRWLAG